MTDQLALPDLLDVPREDAGDEPEGCLECGVDPCACPDPLGEGEEYGISSLPPRETVEMVERLTEPPVRQSFSDGGRILPLDALAAIWASPANGALIARRVDLIIRHGAKAATRAGRPPRDYAREARERLGAVLERLQGDCPTLEQLQLARNTAATAGGILLALVDALDAAIVKAS